MKKEYITIPNIVTSLRLLGALIILFLKPFSLSFFIIYFIAGFTDCIDGFLARKLNSVSEFGSKLDSVCDLTFYSALAIKIMPRLLELLPNYIWYFVLVVVIIRIIIYSFGAFKHKQLVSNHTYLNKTTNVLIYFLPLVISFNCLEPYAWILLGISMVAAIEEFLKVIFQKDLNNQYK